MYTSWPSTKLSLGCDSAKESFSVTGINFCHYHTSGVSKKPSFETQKHGGTRLPAFRFCSGVWAWQTNDAPLPDSEMETKLNSHCWHCEGSALVSHPFWTCSFSTIFGMIGWSPATRIFWGWTPLVSCDIPRSHSTCPPAMGASGQWWCLTWRNHLSPSAQSRLALLGPALEETRAEKHFKETHKMQIVNYYTCIYIYILYMI